MTKKEFLNELAKGIAGIPDEDITRSLEFYSEMIDDRMEEGKSEEEAVAEIGTVKDAVSQILAEIPITKLIKEKVKKKRKLGTLEIVLLILGAPIWLSLLVAAFAGILSVYISVWAVIISLWAVFASLGACTLGGIAAGGQRQHHAAQQQDRKDLFHRVPPISRAGACPRRLKIR